MIVACLLLELLPRPSSAELPTDLSASAPEGSTTHRAAPASLAHFRHFFLRVFLSASFFTALGTPCKPAADVDLVRFGHRARCVPLLRLFVGFDGVQEQVD